MAITYGFTATPPIQTLSVSAQSTVTTTSATPAVYGSMTLTPPQGIYLVIFDKIMTMHQS